MNGMDDMLNQLFQDKPIAQESLRSFQDSVMKQILAYPVDFQAEIRRAERQKWGLIILSVLLLTGMGILFTAWFAGAWLQSLVTPVTSWILANVPGLAMVARVWSFFVQKWPLLAQLKLGAETLWQQYAFGIIGIAAMGILIEGDLWKSKRSSV